MFAQFLKMSHTFVQHNCRHFAFNKRIQQQTKLNRKLTAATTNTTLNWCTIFKWTGIFMCLAFYWLVVNCTIWRKKHICCSKLERISQSVKIYLAHNLYNKLLVDNFKLFPSCFKQKLIFWFIGHFEKKNIYLLRSMHFWVGNSNKKSRNSLRKHENCHFRNQSN